VVEMDKIEIRKQEKIRRDIIKLFKENPTPNRIEVRKIFGLKSDPFPKFEPIEVPSELKMMISHIKSTQRF
jgi:hypothetical protein